MVDQQTVPLEIRVAAETIEGNPADPRIEIEPDRRRESALGGLGAAEVRELRDRVHGALPVEGLRVGQQRLVFVEILPPTVEGLLKEKLPSSLEVLPDTDLEPDQIVRELLFTAGVGSNETEDHSLHGVGGTRHDVLGIADDSASQPTRAGEQRTRTQPGDAVAL